MTDWIPITEHHERILNSGLPKKTISKWLDDVETLKLAKKSDGKNLKSDTAKTGALIRKGWDFCNKLPLKSERNKKELAAGQSLVYFITTLCRNVCEIHRKTMYEKLTNNYRQFLRTEELAWKAAELWPGIVPTHNELKQEEERIQKDKDGMELNQGIFFSQLLMEPEAGIHQLHAMLRPKAESEELLHRFIKKGLIKLDHITVEKKDGAGYITMSHPRYLNAEDDTTVPDLETAVDLVTMHPEINIGILRGEVVEHPKYKGRRVFDSGINLTKIYQGKLPYLMYLTRDFGVVNKLYYGLAGDSWNEDDPNNTVEKLWVAAVESFAIGGGCQLLLVMDYVIAESGSYFSLPARKEGIIPGAANLRLARFLGDSLAREAILFDKQFKVESPEAARLINLVVPREKMDETIQEFIGKALGSGMVSAAGNRKVLRIPQENMEIYRRYMANFAEIQAYCHLSDQLIVNLEKYWKARERKL